VDECKPLAGGAFPEIHIAQYPPGLGLVSLDKAGEKPKAGAGNQVATVTVTANGQGLTLVHFSAQLNRLLDTNYTLRHPLKPPGTP